MQEDIGEKARDSARQTIAPIRSALYDFDAKALSAAIRAAFAPDPIIQLAYPFERLSGADDFFESALSPLAHAFASFERRDAIVMAGAAEDAAIWVGCCGYYTGAFTKTFLDIPPTGQFATMRFHEFYRLDGDQIVEVQALWDIPELMHQAGAWPMTPQLGAQFYAQAPSTQDGLAIVNRNGDHAQQSQKLVAAMCADLGNFASGGVEAMRLDHYWHPKCSWYGPYGIGAGRGLDGFRRRHQIPFLNALPDREGAGTFFADGDYVAVTGWPNMKATVSGGGWMGIAPANQQITMRSLDFWRCENGMIRENWVLVDLLSVYDQIGVDVFARMREMTSR